MSDSDKPTHSVWNVRRVVILAVVLNVLVHLGLLTAGLLGEGEGSLMERARIYTDVVPAPVNVWSTGFHLPAWLAAGLTLLDVNDRDALPALVLPQLAFLVVSSAQTALVAAGLFRLWNWGRTRLRRSRTGPGG